MPLFNLLVDALLPYLHLLLIAGSIYPGEEAIIFFSILAGQDIISIWEVIIIGALGVLLVDHILFWIGKSKYFSKIHQWAMFKKGSRVFNKFLHKMHHEKPFLVLFLTKFIFGLRHISVLSISARGMKLRKFFLYDVLAFALWAIIIIPLAWLAGRGFTLGLKIASRLEKLLLLAIIIVIIFYLAEWLVKKWIMKRR